MSNHDTTKVHSQKVSPKARELYPTLTIASHYRPDRIGERFSIESRNAEVSRNTPNFLASSGRERPLDDSYLSRTPILFEQDGLGNIWIDPNGRDLSVNGQALQVKTRFSFSQLRAGLILDLSRRVCLYLHEGSRSNQQMQDMDLIGENTGIQRVREDIRKVADLDVPVLIRGESGSGKELVAHAIHNHSQRRSQALVSVNMGSLTPNLAAAELLGAVRGGFTGAVADRPGYFRTAHRSTIFLDEIGEAPSEIQALLLRVLETSEVFPVGSQKGFQVDVRLLAATDANLEQMLGDGNFKAPLLHRLGSYEITIPPLRKRREDIMRLFIHFASNILEKTGLPNTSEEPWIPSHLAAQLLNYHWPGNVRQLRNLVYQLVIDNRGKPVLEISPRVEQLFTAHFNEKANDAKVETDLAPKSAKRKAADVSEAELLDAMEANQWAPAAAARALGIPRASIYDLGKRYQCLQMVEDLTDYEIRDALEQNGNNLAAAAQQLKVSVNGLRRRLSKM